MERPEAASADVVVIGGGIIGCASAAIMADRGARVVLVEWTSVGAGASGRNLGAIQHPFDPVLAPLYHESLTRYRALADTGASPPSFSVGRSPAGLLLLHRDAEAAERQSIRMAEVLPELEPLLVDPDELARSEPSLAGGLWAVRLETGHPVPPAGATDAWARLAEERGARLLVGMGGRPVLDGSRTTGVVLEDGTTVDADAVLIAAGPWSPRLIDPGGGWQPITPTYGVTLQLRLDGRAPHHILEEDEVDVVNRAASATARASDAQPDAEPPSLFSLASAGGISTLGSTFLPAEPDGSRMQALLLRRAAEFLPAIAQSEILGRRVCARPQSIDGRPFIGAVGADGLYVCAGHGPWGISIGPATAAIVARAVLDGTPPPAELAANRPI